MAAPPIRGSTNTTATINPTSPAGTQVGDLVMVFTWEVAGAGVPTHTLQSGFTEIFSQAHDDGSTDGRNSVAYKIATGAGAAGYQAYTSSDGTNVFSGIIVLTAGTFDEALIKFASTNNTSNAVPDPPAVASLDAAKDYLMLAGATWHFSSSGTLNPTAPTNYTLLLNLVGGALGDLAVSTRNMEPVGATSEDPVAYNDNLGPNGTTAFTIAIPEASAGTTVDLTPVTETDTAQAISFVKTILKSLGVVAEVDEPQALVVVKTIFKSLTSVSEADSAISLSAIKSITIAPASEADVAQALNVGSGTHFVDLTAVSEEDAAQAVAFVKTIFKSLSPVTEIDLVMTITLDDGDEVTVVIRPPIVIGRF